MDETDLTPPSQKYDFLIRALRPGNAGWEKVVNSSFDSKLSSRALWW